MSDADIDDDFDDNFVDDDDAKMVEEAETSVRTRLSSLEKRRLIDNLLEEKRLAKELKDDLDDIDNFDEDIYGSNEIVSAIIILKYYLELNF